MINKNNMQISHIPAEFPLWMENKQTKQKTEMTTSKEGKEKIDHITQKVKKG